MAISAERSPYYEGACSRRAITAAALAATVSSSLAGRRRGCRFAGDRAAVATRRFRSAVSTDAAASAFTGVEMVMESMVGKMRQEAATHHYEIK